jgi:hypothetical protein
MDRRAILDLEGWKPTSSFPGFDQILGVCSAASAMSRRPSGAGRQFLARGHSHRMRPPLCPKQKGLVRMLSLEHSDRAVSELDCFS